MDMSAAKMGNTLYAAWLRFKSDKFFPVIIPHICRTYHCMCLRYKKKYGSDSTIKLPRGPLLLKYYQKAIRIYLTYMALRYTCSSALSYILTMIINLNSPIHCYLVGRFIFHVYVEELLAFMFVSLHISWHIYTQYNPKSYSLNMFLFLLIEDEQLQTTYRLLEMQSEQSNEIITSQLRSIKGSELNFTTRHKFLNPNRTCNVSATRVLFYRENQLTNIRSLNINERAIINDKSNTCCNDHYNNSSPTADNISYCLRQSKRKLRPNRTLEARRSLKRIITNAFVFTSSTLIILTCIIAPLLFYINFDPVHYIQRYPGCDPELERHIDNNDDLSQISTYKLHRLVSYAGDILENFIIWTESCILLLSSWTLIYLLNYDALLYWRHLDTKLNLLTSRARKHFHSNLVNQQLDWPLCNNQDCELERRIYDFQIEYYDFFKQINYNNEVISDLLTFTYTTWLVFFVILGHYSYNYYEQYHSYTLAILVSVLELFHLACITWGSLSLADTHTKCVRSSYSTLCTLMAYDQNPENKLRFIQLIDFCLLRTRSVYTLFGKLIPYTKTTYLTIFGWSLSGFLIMESLIRR